MDKTELLWAGTRHFLSLVGGSFPSLPLAGDTIHPNQPVTVLGVVISADLSLEKMLPTSAQPASTIFVVFKVKHIRRTLSKESAATLVRAFVTSPVDYCNVVFAGAPKTVTNKLQRVLNAAAPVVSGSRKLTAA